VSHTPNINRYLQLIEALKLTSPTWSMQETQHQPRLNMVYGPKMHFLKTELGTTLPIWWVFIP